MDDLRKKMNEAAQNAVRKIIQARQLNPVNRLAMTKPANEVAKGVVSGARSVFEPYARTVAEAGYQGGRYVADPTFRQAVNNPNSLSMDQIQSVNARPQQMFLKPEQMQNRAQIVKTGATATGKALAGTYGLTAGVPTLASTALIGGTINAAVAPSGQKLEAFGEGVGQSPMFSGAGKFSSNVTTPLLGKTASFLPKPAQAVLTGRLGQGAVNVAENIGIDAATGGNGLDPLNLGLSFATGVAGRPFNPTGTGAARSLVKKGVSLAKDELDDLVRAQDILVNPKRYFPKDTSNPVAAEQAFNRIQEQARKTINVLAQRYAPENVLVKAGDDMNKMATELYKLSEKGKLGVFDVPAYGFVQGKSTSNVSQTDSRLSKQLSQESIQAKTSTTSPSLQESVKGGKTLTEQQKPQPQDISQLSMKQDLAQQSITPKGMKERKFSETIMNSERTTLPTKADYTRQYYTPITNKQTLKDADSVINRNVDKAVNIALNGESTALNNAISMRLVEKFQKEGNVTQAIELLEKLSQKPTSQGQAIQVLSYWSKLTPAGAVRKAQNLVSKANLERGGETLSLTPEKAKKISAMAESLQKMGEGRDKMIATAKLLDEIESVVPPTLANKISTLQTMAQLLNPKTAIRNTVGNLLFATSENAAGAVAAILDIPVSIVTGKRSKALPNIVTQAKGFKTGFKEGLEEALKGVNLDKTGGQVDLNARQTFTGPFLGTLEKIMNVELRATDKAFYKAAFDDSLLSQMKLAKVEEPTPEMLRVAHLDGLYKTFQDDTVIAKAFSRLKKTLNLGKGFGLGDIILKYPKTPANIIQRGIDYSPLGVISSLMNIARPLAGGKFDQKAFVESLSRSMVGTMGLVSTGYVLHKAGVITGKSEEDIDVSALQRQMGMGGYKLNVDGLIRFVSSGFNPQASQPKEGDRLITYDWAQPMAIGLSMGANIAENKGRISNEGQLSAIVNAVQGGVDTLQEQPLVTGIKQFMRTGDAVKAIADGVQSLPASFVPTLSNQVNQAFDNTARETHSPDYFEKAKNLAVAKVPVLAQSLPARSTVLGGTAERYQDGSNNIFNVFFNPAFVSKIKSNAGANEVLRIFEDTGETSQAPRVVAKKIKINGVDRELTGEEISKYQNYVGSRSNSFLNSVVDQPWFKSMDDEEKVKFIQRQLTDINSAAKVELFGNKTENLSANAKGIVAGAFSSSTDEQSASNLNYYNLAQASSEEKVDLIKEYTKGLDKRGFAEFLILGRKKVNGKRLVNDTVVNNFLKEGLITSQDAKFLKNTEVDDTNKIKVKFTGRGSSAKIKKISGIKVANPKRLQIKRSKALSSSELGKLVLKAKPTKRAKIVAPRII